VNFDSTVSVTLDYVTWREVAFVPTPLLWRLDRKTLGLTGRSSERLRPGPTTTWSCNLHSVQELRSRVVQYQQERQEGNRI
jgi:hypothetical protein